MKLKFEGEANRRDMFDSILRGSMCRITGIDHDFHWEERSINRITLTVEAGNIAILEIEEYLLNDGRSDIGHTIVTRHAVDFIDIETFDQLSDSSIALRINGTSVADSVADNEEQRPDITEQYRENFNSSIDDLDL